MLQKKNFYINGAWVKPKKENNIDQEPDKAGLGLAALG